MPITEQDALKAIDLYGRLEDPNEKRQALELAARYESTAKAEGKPLYPSIQKEKIARSQQVENAFLNTETYGLKDESLAKFRERYAAKPEEAAGYWNAHFLANSLGVDVQEVRQNRALYRNAYAKAEFGEPVETETDLFNRIAQKVSHDKEIRETAHRLALANVDPAQALASYEAPLNEKDRKRHEATFEAATQRIEPYRVLIDQTVSHLREAKGLEASEQPDGVADPVDVPTVQNLALEILKVPQEDRDLVLSAIIEKGRLEAGEDPEKWNEQMLLESFTRGVANLTTSLESTLTRDEIDAVANLIESDVEFPESWLSDAETFEENLSANVKGAYGSLPRADQLLLDPIAFQNGIQRRPGKKAKMPPELREQLQAQLSANTERLNLERSLRRIADGEIDPARTESLITNGLFMAAESIPYTLAAMIPGGIAITATAMTEQAHEMLSDQFPDMDEATKRRISPVAGLAMGLVEKVSARILTGRLPTTGRLLNSAVQTPGQLATRFGIRTAEGAGAEMVQENVQNFLPLWTAEVMRGLGEDVPEIPWDDVYGAAWEEQPQLLAAVLPLVLIGAGVGTRSDYKNAAALLSNSAMIEAAGASSAEAVAIAREAQQGDLDGATSQLNEALSETWSKGKDISETVQEASQKVTADAQRAANTMSEAEQLGIIPSMRHTKEGWSLQFKDGTKLDFDSYSDAEAQQMDYLKKKKLRVQSETRSSIRVAQQSIEEGRQLNWILSPHAMTADQLREEGQAAPTENREALAQRVADRYKEITTETALADPSPETAEAVTRILGSNETFYADGVLQTTIKLYEGLTPLTVIEEKTEGDAFIMLADGKRDWLVSAIRSFEETTGLPVFLDGRKDADLEDNEIIEAYSDMTVSYFVGKSGKGEGRIDWSNGTFFKDAAKAINSDAGGILGAYGAFFKDVWERASYMEMTGAVTPELEMELARSLGLDEAVIENRKIEEGGDKIIEEVAAESGIEIDRSGFQPTEDMPFSILKTGPGFESFAMPDGRTLQGPATFSILAFHGTPHKVDRFSTEKIGTGEGAQAQPSFSAIRVTPDQDAEYMAAVESGDMETAQRMVNEAAKAAGFTVEGWHNTGADFDTFDLKTARTASDIQGFFFKSEQDENKEYGPNEKRTYIKLNNPANATQAVKGFNPAATDDAGIKQREKLIREGYDGAIIEDEWSGMGYDEIIAFYPNQIKSADPITYDSNGEVIPLSQRFNPDQDNINFSAIQLPTSSDIEARIATKYSAFQRSPELRQKLVENALTKTREGAARLATILPDMRSKKAIEIERKAMEEEILNDKLTDMRGELSALERDQEAISAATPLLSQLYEIEYITDKNGVVRTIRRGAMKSKAQAKRDGNNLNEYNDAPKLPAYIYGGSRMPDQAATDLGFDSLPKFWEALEAEAKSAAKLNKEYADAEKAFKQAQKEARNESKAWATEQIAAATKMQNSRTPLVEFMRLLNNLTSTLPPELRGKIGGFMNLAQMKGPEAMLAEIERRVETMNRELERWLRNEIDAEVKKLFDRARADSKPGKKKKSKLGPIAQAIIDRTREAYETKNAEFGKVRAMEIEDILFENEDSLSPTDYAVLKGELQLLPMFAGWRDQYFMTVNEEGKTVRGKGGIMTPGKTAAERAAALDALRRLYEDSRNEWAQKIAQERERRTVLRERAMKDAGGKPSQITRDLRKELDEGTARIGDKIFNLFSFHQTLGAIFGEGSETQRYFSDWQRRAETATDREFQDFAGKVDELFRRLAGGKKLKGDQLQFDLGTLNDPTAITAGKGRYQRKLSQMEAMTVLLFAQQEDGIRHLRGRVDDDGTVTSDWHYNEAFVADVEQGLTSESREILAFIREAYAGEWESINEVHERMNGVQMVRHDNYAPLTMQPRKVSETDQGDPNAAAQGGSIMTSMTPGSLRTRSGTIAEPKFENALQVALAHKRAMAHWKNHAELATELTAILGLSEMKATVETNAGRGAYSTLNAWLKDITDGGTVKAGAHLAINQATSRAMNRVTQMNLFGRLGTVVIQATQLAASSAKMPQAAFLSRLSKLVTGRLDYSWSQARNSDFMKSRAAQLPVVVQHAFEGLASFRPSALTEASRITGLAINESDVFWTAGTYAIVFDYHKSRLRKAGMAESEIEAEAHRLAEIDTEEIAQPTRRGTRSIFENVAPTGLSAMTWAHASEARKNAALMIYSRMNRGKVEAGRSIFAVFVVQGLISTIIRAAWRDMRDDEDEEFLDERHWNPKKMLLAWATEPLYGVPFVGEEVQRFIFGLGGEYMPDGGMLSAISRSVGAIKRAPENVVNMATLDLTEENIEQVLKDVQALLNATGIFNQSAASATVLMNILRDAFAVGTNLNPD